MPVPVDPAAFKSALSRWSSGVCVITTRAADGAPVGITASSFSSLSLEPPLVLFCLGHDSTNFDAFAAAQRFAIHVLSAGQAALSGRFASRGGDKFAGLAFTPGLGGMPLLVGCLAVLECRVQERVPCGDHVIYVGAVDAASVSEDEPLVYYRGAYRALAAREP